MLRDLKICLYQAFFYSFVFLGDPPRIRLATDLGGRAMQGFRPRIATLSRTASFGRALTIPIAGRGEVELGGEDEDKVSLKYPHTVTRAGLRCSDFVTRMGLKCPYFVTRKANDYPHFVTRMGSKYPYFVTIIWINYPDFVTNKQNKYPNFVHKGIAFPGK